MAAKKTTKTKTRTAAKKPVRNASRLHVIEISPKNFAVLLDRLVLRKGFKTAAAATLHMRSIQARRRKTGSASVKLNPAGNPSSIRLRVVEYLKLRGYSAMAEEVRKGGDMVKALKQIYGYEPAKFRPLLKTLILRLDPKAKKRTVKPAAKRNAAPVVISQAVTDDAGNKGILVFSTKDGDAVLKMSDKIVVVDRKDLSKRNGVRGWYLRRKAAAQYRKELKASEKARKAHERRRKLEGQIRKNPGMLSTIVEIAMGGSAALDIAKNLGYSVTGSKRRPAAKAKAARKPGSTTKAKPRKTAKKPVRKNSPYKFKAGDRVTVTSGPHKGRTVTIVAGSMSLNKPVYTVREKIVTRGVTSNWQFSESGLKRAAKKNPDAGTNYEGFHGRKPTRRLDLLMPVDFNPRGAWTLGKLIKLYMWGGKEFDFSREATGKTFYLAKQKGSKTLFIIGARMDKERPELKPGEFIDYGLVHKVLYETVKVKYGDTADQGYIHPMGEEGGRKPRLFVDRGGFGRFYGGDYTVEDEGIRN